MQETKITDKTSEVHKLYATGEKDNFFLKILYKLDPSGVTWSHQNIAQNENTKKIAIKRPGKFKNRSTNSEYALLKT